MADFILSVADADVERVAAAICGPFNVSYVNTSITDPPSAEAAKVVLIELIQSIVVQVEAAAAVSSITPPALS